MRCLSATESWFAAAIPEAMSQKVKGGDGSERTFTLTCYLWRRSAGFSDLRLFSLCSRNTNLKSRFFEKTTLSFVLLSWENNTWYLTCYVVIAKKTSWKIWEGIRRKQWCGSQIKYKLILKSDSLFLLGTVRFWTPKNQPMHFTFIVTFSNHSTAVFFKHVVSSASLGQKLPDNPVNERVLHQFGCSQWEARSNPALSQKSALRDFSATRDE